MTERMVTFFVSMLSSGLLIGTLLVLLQLDRKVMNAGIEEVMRNVRGMSFDLRKWVARRTLDTLKHVYGNRIYQWAGRSLLLGLVYTSMISVGLKFAWATVIEPEAAQEKARLEAAADPGLIDTPAQEFREAYRMRLVQMPDGESVPVFVHLDENDPYFVLRNRLENFDRKLGRIVAESEFRRSISLLQIVKGTAVDSGPKIASILAVVGINVLLDLCSVSSVIFLLNRGLRRESLTSTYCLIGFVSVFSFALASMTYYAMLSGSPNASRNVLLLVGISLVTIAFGLLVLVADMGEDNLLYRILAVVLCAFSYIKCRDLIRDITLPDSFASPEHWSLHALPFLLAVTSILPGLLAMFSAAVTLFLRIAAKGSSTFLQASYVWLTEEAGATPLAALVFVVSLGMGVLASV